MKCPRCQFENREGLTFCEECGAKFELRCPNCKTEIPIGRKFCGKCGHNLKYAKELSNLSSEPETPPLKPTDEKLTSDATPITGERKHITVLFSDLIGYTAISERLGPEEAKEITTRIFNEISKIISKYEGFIEKYAGDAVMGLFGAIKAHEDDPIRAIQAAREIHSYVESISPQYEKRIKQPLSMHTGINTGLVVTGEINLEKGTHGVMGDTVNVASRLSGLGKSGEILVGRDTYSQAEGYFEFEDLGHLEIKGKELPIRVYKTLTPKEQPVKKHRLHGLRAELIARIVEMEQLAEAVQNLRDGIAVP